MEIEYWILDGVLGYHDYIVIVVFYVQIYTYRFVYFCSLNRSSWWWWWCSRSTGHHLCCKHKVEESWNWVHFTLTCDKLITWYKRSTTRIDCDYPTLGMMTNYNNLHLNRWCMIFYINYIKNKISLLQLYLLYIYIYSRCITQQKSKWKQYRGCLWQPLKCNSSNKASRWYH